MTYQGMVFKLKVKTQIGEMIMDKYMKNEEEFNEIAKKSARNKHATFSYLIRALEFELEGSHYGQIEKTLIPAMKRVYKVFTQTQINEFRGKRAMSPYKDFNEDVVACLWKIANGNSWKIITKHICDLDHDLKQIHDLTSNDHVKAMVAIRDIMLSYFNKATTWDAIELIGRAFENSMRISVDSYSTWRDYCCNLHESNSGDISHVQTDTVFYERKNQLQTQSLDNIFPGTHKTDE